MVTLGHLRVNINMNMNMFIAITRCLLPGSGAKAMRWETAPFGIVRCVEFGVYGVELWSEVIRIQ